MNSINTPSNSQFTTHSNQEERNRISQELHDDLGSAFTLITLASQRLKTGTSDKLKELETIFKSTDIIYNKINEIIWGLNSTNDSLFGVLTYLRKFVNSFETTTDINFLIISDETLPNLYLNATTRKNIVLSIKEIINNAIKHSNCSNFKLNFSFENDIFNVMATDDGIGFSQIEKQNKGNGLINIQKSIKSIGGTLQSNSSSFGTNYLITFPILEQTHAKIRVVIVEDDREVQKMLEEIVSVDYECIGVFSTGKQAINKIPILKPDVVLMDIGLPDISGIDCIKKLKLAGIESEFMICTVFEDSIRVMQALEAGATSYVLKRCTSGFLINSIMEVTQGGSPMSPEIARMIVKRFYDKNEKSHKNENNIVTAREKEILVLLSQGLLYKEISSKLGISINTIKSHCYNVYQKLHVTNKVEAINKMFSDGESD